MATDPNRLAGVATVTVDGKSFSISGEGTYQLSGTKREPLIGQSGYDGYSEIPQPGNISWQGRDANHVDIAALNEATNVTVVLSLANGKTVTGRNMARIGDPIVVKTDDATFPAEFIGPDVSVF